MNADTNSQERRQPVRPRPPKRVGSFAVTGSLGGRAGALLGRREHDGATVVLRMPLRSSEHDAFRERARALAAVSHPALVPIVAIGEHAADHGGDGEEGGGAIPFVAEAFQTGGSLRELLVALRGCDLAEARVRGRDRMPGSGSFEARAAALGARIADALGALHRAGVSHGAVRPSAILFTRDAAGEPDVALGGYRLDDAARWSDGLGYAAPELVRDHGPATRASDLIALATTLYELLALHPAFEEARPDALARAVREHEPARPTALQPFLRAETDAVLLQAMQKQPERRTPSMEALAEDLRALAAGRAVTARMPGRWRRALGLMWERRRGLFTIGALFAAALAYAER